jgi:hypothetical protein
MTPRNVLEYFTLLEEHRRAKQIADGDRETARALLANAELERAAAAERWIGDRPDDAIARLTRAVADVDGAASAIGVDVDPVVEANEAAATYDALLTHYERTHRVAAGLVSSTPKRWFRRAVRLLIPIAVVMLVVFVRRVRTFVHPIASGQFSLKYDARYAIDGRADTAWIAPDATNAWIDFELMPPRPVKWIRLLDTRNSPNNDREVKEFRIEFWREGKPIDAVEGTYPNPDRPGYIRVDVNRPWNVEKVRFVIKSYAEKGGGLAEIEFH